MAEKAVLLNSGSSFGTFDVVHVPGDSHSFDASFGKSSDAAYAVSTSAKSVVIRLLENGRVVPTTHADFQRAPRPSAREEAASLGVVWSEDDGLRVPGWHGSLHPASAFVRVWSGWMLFLTLFYCAFVEPVYISFNRTLADSTSLIVVDFFAGLSFFLDVFINFRTGIYLVCEGHVKLVLEPRTIAVEYLSRAFLVDTLSALPFVAQLVYFAAYALDGVPPARHSTLVILVRLFRMLRAVRLWKVLTAGGAAMGLEIVLAQHTGSPFAIFGLASVYWFACFINLMACIMLFTAEHQGVCSSWVAQLAVPAALHPGAAQTCGGLLGPGMVLPHGYSIYLSALYFATTVITTTGFGDVVAKTLLEKAITMTFMLLGVLFVAILTSHLVGLLSAAGGADPNTEFKAKMMLADRFVKEHRLSGSLRENIFAYVQQAYSPHEAGAVQQWRDAELITELPLAVRAEAVEAMLGEGVLHSVLAGASAETLVWVAGRLRPRRLHTGHHLFVAGDAVAELFVTASGSLLLTAPSGRQVSPPLPGRGHLVGGAAAARSLRGAAAAGAQLWPLNAQAVVECSLFSLSLDDLRTAVRMGALATPGRTEEEEEAAVCASLTLRCGVERALRQPAM